MWIPVALQKKHFLLKKSYVYLDLDTSKHQFTLLESFKMDICGYQKEANNTKYIGMSWC